MKTIEQLEAEIAAKKELLKPIEKQLAELEDARRWIWFDIQNLLHRRTLAEYALSSIIKKATKSD